MISSLQGKCLETAILASQHEPRGGPSKCGTSYTYAREHHNFTPLEELDTDDIDEWDEIKTPLERLLAYEEVNAGEVFEVFELRLRSAEEVLEANEEGDCSEYVLHHIRPLPDNLPPGSIVVSLLLYKDHHWTHIKNREQFLEKAKKVNCLASSLACVNHEIIKGLRRPPMCVVDVKAEDNTCFKFATIAAAELNPPEDVELQSNCARLNLVNEAELHLDFTGVTYPAKVEDFKMFEKNNPGYGLQILMLMPADVPFERVCGLQSRYALQRWYQPSNTGAGVKLLYLLCVYHDTAMQGHYLAIPNLTTFLNRVRRYTSENGKAGQPTRYCTVCFLPCSPGPRGDAHVEGCTLPKGQFFVLPSPRKNLLQFMDWYKELPPPFVGFLDFESMLIKPADLAGEHIDELGTSE